MDNLEQQYEQRDRNEHESGDAGSTSPGVQNAPRGNQEADEADVRKGVEKLDRIVNW